MEKNRNIIIVIVLVILVLLTVIQTVQLNTLKKQVSEGKITASSAGSGAGAGGLPSSIDNLPNMVGGC